MNEAGDKRPARIMLGDLSIVTLAVACVEIAALPALARSAVQWTQVCRRKESVLRTGVHTTSTSELLFQSNFWYPGSLRLILE